jgi:hypothetical protein
MRMRVQGAKNLPPGRVGGLPFLVGEPGPGQPGGAGGAAHPSTRGPSRCGNALRPSRRTRCFYCQGSLGAWPEQTTSSPRPLRHRCPREPRPGRRACNNDKRDLLPGLIS